MGSYITQYPNLQAYVVLAGAAVNFPINDGILLSGGVYGAYATDTVTGVVNDVGVNQGNNPFNPVGDQNARTELNNLYYALSILTPNATFPSGPNYELEPGVYEITGNLEFLAADTITFTNTGSIPNPQWVFLVGGALNFTGVTNPISYQPNSEERIYWVAATNITVDENTTSSLQGVFIASETITFAGPTYPNAGAAFTVGDGVSLAGGAITFLSQGTTMEGFGYQPICFLEGTPINTDQGIIPINKIIADFHTIDNKRIVGVTQTRDSNTFLVCFKKDSLGENVPSQDTIMSRYHRVEYNGEMIKAHQYLEKFENVVKVDYTGQLMYNILMEKHDKMIVNNLVCETLHPDNPAKRLNRANFVKLSIPNTGIECI